MLCDSLPSLQPTHAHPNPAQRLIHQQKFEAKAHEETHDAVGDYVKSMIFGGLDGILTSFAIVAGAAGGGLPVEVVLVLGFSNIFADAFSMGMGEYLSSKAHNEFVLKEKERETWYVFVFFDLRRRRREEVDVCSPADPPTHPPTHSKRKTNRELENFREGEIREMIDIYVERGMEPDDAEVRPSPLHSTPPTPPHPPCSIHKNRTWCARWPSTTSSS